MAIKNPAKDPLKGIAKVIQTVGSGKTGIKTIDRQKKKDAILTKNLKKLGLVSVSRTGAVAMTKGPSIFN